MTEFLNTTAIEYLSATGTTEIPMARQVGTGWVPVIFHPDRKMYRFARYPNKAKSSPTEAIAYAYRTIWYRQTRKNEITRKFYNH
jgi:hypothetical protein